MLVNYLSGLTGISADALVLLLGMLAGYPLGFVWRYLPNNPTTKHIFSTVTGLGLMWFAYDWPGVTHTMVCASKSESVCNATLLWVGVSSRNRGRVVIICWYVSLMASNGRFSNTDHNPHYFGDAEVPSSKVFIARRLGFQRWIFVGGLLL